MEMADGLQFTDSGRSTNIILPRCDTEDNVKGLWPFTSLDHQMR